MESTDDRYVLVFNGEVYNHDALRGELAKVGHRFRGHSDTEVILAAVEAFGPDGAVPQLHGMFALAIWDRQEQCLWLARDRVGKKPLYYGWHGGSFLFGSELKALGRHPDFRDELDQDALGQYLQYGWVAAPMSIYRHVSKLPQGHLLRVDLGSAGSEPQPQPYWSAARIAENGTRNPFGGNYEEAVDALDAVLNEAVRDRMIADVEIGALLSGGIDSSTVVALMQRQAERPVKTFSIGFSETRYNEAEYAAAVARHLGTDHYEMYVTPRQALDVVDQLPHIYDEPFADSSQIPTYLVCKLAREQLKVVLTGDGGDEQFAGYRRYQHCLEHWRQVSLWPGALRPGMGQLYAGLGALGWRLSERRATAGRSVPKWVRKMTKPSQRAWNWNAQCPQQILANKLNKCVPVDQLVAGARDRDTGLSSPSHWADVDDPLLAMLHYDYIGYLPDDILVKVDRASMAVGLEARAPLLDHRVLELAWSLPQDYLYRPGTGKRVLRDLLLRHVPRELVDRPKRGFNVPIKEWLVGPLRDWTEDLLDERRLREQGIFDVEQVRATWLQHRSGLVNRSELLWSVLMFQAWWEARPNGPP